MTTADLTRLRRLQSAAECAHAALKTETLRACAAPDRPAMREIAAAAGVDRVTLYRWLRESQDEGAK